MKGIRGNSPLHSLGSQTRVEGGREKRKDGGREGRGGGLGGGNEINPGNVVNVF